MDFSALLLTGTEDGDQCQRFEVAPRGRAAFQCLQVGMLRNTGVVHGTTKGR